MNLSKIKISGKDKERKLNRNAGFSFLVVAIITFFLSDSLIKYPICIGLLIVACVNLWRWIKR